MIRTPHRSGLIRRLLNDTTANTLAISAAAVIPLIGVVGGGIDTGRLYLAQSRLQQACDSATLAARKQLGARELEEDGIPADLEETADNFFEANYLPGAYGSTDTEYELSFEEGTRLDGEADTVVPTTLMSIFGYDNVDIKVNCSADLNLPNIDVVLVLDVSGSMRGAKIEALREAVFGFYDEIMAVAPANARVRIGVLPYNATVNVGRMLNDLSVRTGVDYLVNEHTYQTRVPIAETRNVPRGTEGSTEVLTSDERENIPREPEWMGSDRAFDYRWATNAGGRPHGKAGCDDMDGTYTVDGQRWVVTDDDYFPYYFEDESRPDALGGCVARVRKYQAQITEWRYEFRPETIDVQRFTNFETVGRPTGRRRAIERSTWTGCIEEATTVATTDFSPIPAGAHDMNIDLIPTDEETRWRPLWGENTFERYRFEPRTLTEDQFDRFTSPPNNFFGDKLFECPAQAFPLTQYALEGGARNAQFESIINSLVADGATMHDLGMIWAGRMISPDGIFGTDNQIPDNGEPIARHVIFMTDGLNRPALDNNNIAPLAAYGDYDMDRRFGRAPDGRWNNDELLPIHNARF
ncbi:MAG: TadE/TadG family type IV pilus assembly protein, partial [Pontixanthobacter sp.]